METIDKSNINKLTDDQLFKALKTCGLTVGPITGTTRSIYEKRLKNFLENNSTLISDKTITNTKSATKASTIENLTSSSLSSLSEQINAKSLQSVNKDSISTKTNSIFSKESSNSPKKTAQNDFASRPKNIIEQPLSRSQSLRENPMLERQKNEEASLISKRMPQPLSKNSEFTIRANNLVEKPESRSVNTLDNQLNKDFRHIQQSSSSITTQPSSRTASNDFTTRLTEKSTQRFNGFSENSTNRLNNFMEKEIPKDNIRPINVSSQVTNQVSSTSTASSVSSNTCFKAPVIENISSKSYTSDVTSRYESASSVHLLATKQTMPQIIANKFSAPLATHISSPIVKDKYAERLQSYGLLESTSIRSIARLETEDTNSYSNTKYAPITPGTIRARPSMHTPKPREEEPISTSTSTSSSSSSSSSSAKAVVHEPKKELINFKYLLALLLATVIIYWVIVNYMQSNPENPVDF